VGITSLIAMGFLADVIIDLVAVPIIVVVDLDPMVIALIVVVVDVICDVHLNECYYLLFGVEFPCYQCCMAICFDPLGFGQFEFLIGSLVIDSFAKLLVLENLWYEPKHQISLDQVIFMPLSDNLAFSSQISLEHHVFHLFRELSLHN